MNIEILIILWCAIGGGLGVGFALMRMEHLIDLFRQETIILTGFVVGFILGPLTILFFLEVWRRAKLSAKIRQEIES